MKYFVRFAFLLLAFCLLVPAARAAQVGVDTIGSTAYPNGGMFELPSIKLSNEDNAKCGIASTSSSLAWFGTNTSPAIIIKFDPINMTRLGALTLPEGDNGMFCAAIDRANQYGYFGLSNKIVKINLVNMTRVAELVLLPTDGELGCAMINPQNNMLLLGTNTSPGKVIRINLNTFQRTGTLNLPVTSSNLRSGAISIDGTKAWFGTDQTNARIAIINLVNFTFFIDTQIFELNNIRSVIAESTGNYIYVCGKATYGRLVRLTAGLLAPDSSLDLLSDETNPTCMAVSPDGTRAVIGCFRKLVGVNLASLTRMSGSNLSSRYENLSFVFYVPGSTKAYGVSSDSPAIVVEFVLLSGQAYQTNDFSYLNGSESYFGKAVMSSDGTRIWFGTDTTSPKLIELNASLNQRIAGFAQRSLNSSGGVVGLGLSQDESVLYVACSGGGGTSLISRVGAFNLSNYSAGLAYLLPTQYRLRTAVFDPISNYFYLGINSGNIPYTQRGTMLPFTLPGNPFFTSFNEAIPLSGVANPNGKVYWGHYLAAGTARINVPNYATTGFSIYPLPAGDESIQGLLGRTSPSNLIYGLLSSNPSRVVEVNVNDPNLAVNRRLIMNTPGKQVSSLYSGAIDRADRFAVYTALDNKKLIYHDLSSFNYDILTMSRQPQSVILSPEGDEAWTGFSESGVPLLGHVALSTKNQIRGTKLKMPTTGKINDVRFYTQNVVQARRKFLDRLPTGDDTMACSAIDRAKNIAYFGTGSFPVRVIAYDLTTRKRISSNAMDDDDFSFASAVINPTGSALYFGTFSNPGKVVRVRTSDLARTGEIILPAGDNNLVAAAIDPAGTFAYYACAESPTRIAKVRLSDMTHITTRNLDDSDEQPRSMVIDSAGQFLYLLCGTSPGKIVKVRLSDFTRVGAAPFIAGENNPNSIVMDDNYLYACCYNSPGSLVRVRISDFTRVSAITLNGDLDFPTFLALSLDKRILTVLNEGAAPQVCRIDAPTFQRIDFGPLRPTEIAATPLLVDNTDLVWSGTDSTPGRVFCVEPLPKPLRLGIYRDLNGARQLAWQSNALAANFDESFITVPISSGTPNKLTLPKGTYWLAWQCDATERVPTYQAGVSGDGFVAYHPHGPFPAVLPTTGDGKYTDTADLWSGYLNYDNRNAVEDFSNWQ